MREREIEVIKNMCECNLRVENVARNMFMHRNTVYYYIQKINKKYGLNARNYNDLKKLEQIADGILKTEVENNDRCKVCGEVIISQNRRDFCSEKCARKYEVQRRKR